MCCWPSAVGQPPSPSAANAGTVVLLQSYEKETCLWRRPCLNRSRKAFRSSAAETLISVFRAGSRPLQLDSATSGCATECLYSTNVCLRSRF